MPFCRYYRIGGITVRLESDMPLKDDTLRPVLKRFEVTGPGDDNIVFRHHYRLPDLRKLDPGRLVYRKAPWAIYRKGDTWTYFSIGRTMKDSEARDICVFHGGYNSADIYHASADCLRYGNWQSLSLFPTDQVWLVPVLADRKAVLLHSAGAVLNGQGLIFAGHSEAGKSTTVTLLKNAGIGAEILCDDRNIVRCWPPVPPATGGSWRVHGTWSHGDVADVSPAAAPLRAILFLHQDTRNEIVPVADRREIRRRLLAVLVRALVTAEWWHRELDVLEQIVKEVPCYIMRFDRSGAIVKEMEKLTGTSGSDVIL